MGKLFKPLFKLGIVVATPAAKEAVKEAGVEMRRLLEMHITGNWGIIPDSDKKQNDLAVSTNNTIRSVYVIVAHPTKTVCITTERDRISTTIFLPEEY